ncbi:MAG: chorismate synthase [Candidatus Thermoplasmatota archaeon]|nr:chorismate synthase [Candidatus Thermoplasmatota archaeon]MCL5731116.1 chorismate synthase [Candidatus Thermoplasmatota archaeon]
MSFTFGMSIRISLFGESHSSYVGGVLDGLPAGLKIERENISRWMERRRPGLSNVTSQRKETDDFTIVSGVVDGYTDGGPLVVLIPNNDVISSTYDEIKDLPRPGHSDYPAWVRYGKHRDYRGGGFFSGRMTAPMVAVGSIAYQILRMKGINVISYISRMGPIEFITSDVIDADLPYSFVTRIPDRETDSRAYELLMETAKSGDSLGARISSVITGVPPGIGEPFFDSCESMISHLMFSIPSVKGIEFGDGFRFTSALGSDVRDEYGLKNGNVYVRQNHNGGILGGLTTGSDITFNVAVKPTSSIRKPQKTVNLASMKEDDIVVKGRHDPCIGIRAVPVIQTLSAFAVLDLALKMSGPGFLDELIEK